MIENSCTYDSILQSWGYKLTTQRKILLDIIIKNQDKHLSVEELYDEIKNTGNPMGLATIYRTIKLFEKIKFIQHIVMDDGVLRYQIIDPDERQEHHHLICEICGNVVDIQDEVDIPKEQDALFSKKVFDEKGFKITRQKIQFYGICKKCASHL
ncbi:Fur family transcriptional regulator [Anaerocolumna sp. AGMB13025]|uniref:Fur family transcriptional regulator n=1 Tax=Anaerocolumna sp. AGMB13025 TaxID=3039116 RepID=UPI00241C2F6B|nr:Fur family transcriptional regulator [Anaerocolumna sp. AGMB13025]WFR59006.1 Fur family transcriptional regulator [Anaerocolumna sp. AGMB13025]